MDKLDDLPEKQDTVLTPQESQILSQLFGQGGPNQEPEPTSRFGGMNWKLIGGTTLAFVILANPWIDSAICKIPYCDSPMTAFGVKVLLFLLIVILLHLFV